MSWLHVHNERIRVRRCEKGNEFFKIVATNDKSHCEESLLVADQYVPNVRTAVGESQRDYQGACAGTD